MPAVKPLIYDKEKEEEFYELWGNQLKQSGNRDADALIEIARKLRRARQVIPYEEFSREMREVGPKLRDALEGRGQYAVIWGEPHTSRRWAWFHIKEGLREPAATVYENQIAEARSVSTFVIVDDASYSGTQIRETIEKIAKHNSRANIIVAVPYMTKRAHSVIRSRKGLPEGVSITVLDHKNMPTLSELLTEEENKLVDMKRKPQEEEDRASANRRFLGRVFMGGGSGKEYDIFKYATVTLFEHKIADSWSVYQRIAHFFDPVRPPYRDKESAYYQEESKQLADGNDGSARSSPAAKPPKEFGDAEKPRSEIRSGGDKGENPLEDSVAPPVFKEPTSRRTPQLARTELRTAGQLELFGPAELLPHGTARVRVDPQTVIELAASQIREGVERNIVKWDPEAGEYRVTGQNARDGLAAVRAAANRRDFSVGGQDVSREALIAGILTGNYIYREDREDIASGGGSVRYFTARPESRNVRRSEMRQKNIAEAQRQKLLDQALKTVVDRGLMTKVQVEQALKVSGIKWVGKKEGMERIGQLRKTDHGYLVELSMEWAQLPYQKEFRTAAKKARLSEAELLDLFENKLAYSLTRCLTQVSVEEFIHAFHLPKIFTRDGSLPSRTVIFLKETSLLRSRPEDAQKIFRFEKVVELLLAQREGSPLRELVERGNFHKKHVRYIEMLREITEEDFYGKTFLGEPLWLGRIGKFLDDIKGIYLTLSEKPQDSRPSGLPRRGLRDMGDFLEVLRIQRWHRNFVTHWLPVESSPHKDWTVNGTADLAGRKVPVIAKRKFSDYYSAGNVGAILSSRLPGKKTLFLMETLRKIHGESFEPKDIERIYVRALGAGTLKAGFYVMVGTSRGIFDFALLLPQSEDDDDHVPIGFLLKGELEVLEKSAQRDPELGIRSGAYLPPKGTNPGALSVSYGGRDLEKMLQNNDEQILQSARLAFLENAISRYIRNMFRMGGYHMVSDFKPANTAHLDLTVRIIDYGIHFYSEKIAQVTFMINTLVEGKSVLGKEWSYPPETDDRQYIFSGILKTFTGSHKPSDADYAYYLGQGLDFLRQIYSDPDGALTPASKKELEKFFRNVGKIEVTDMFTPLATTVSEGDFEAVAREAAASNAKEKRPIRFPDVRNLSLKGQDLSYARLAQRSGVSVPSDSEKMPVGDVIRVLDYISQDYAILPDEIVLDVLAAWARRFRVKMPELKSRDHYRALIRTLRESAEAVSASGRTSVERSVTVKDEDRDFYHELSSFQIQKIFERFSGQDEDKISSAELAMMPYSLEFVLLDVLKSRQKEFNPALSAAYKAALKKQQAISLLVPDGTSSSPDSPIASSRKKARSEMREEDIAEAQREISDRAEVTDRAANANAGEYDLPGQYAVSENLKMFVAGLKEHYSGHLSSLKALDLATGTGSVAFAMASAGVGTITALDINEGMLKRAQRSSSASPKVVFLQGDIFNARQVLERAGRDTIFDLITIGYTLHAYKPEDITELLATARTMLSEGGRLAILGRGLDEIYNRRTMSDYRRILQKAGFDLMTVEGSNHFTLWASSRSEEPISGELKLGRESRRRTNKLPVHARAEVRAERASIKEELSDFRRRLKAIGDLPEGVLYPNSDASYQMVRNGIVPVITAGSRVLEIGTGSGVVLDLLADAGRNLAGLHFVGTDKNPAAVRTARRMLQRFGNVEIREGSLFDPVIGEKFDVIFWNPPWFDGQWKDEEAGADMVDEDYRTVRRFLEEAPAHLTANGRIFILFPVKYFPKLKSPYPFTLRDSYTNGKNLKIGLFEYDPMASRRSGFSELPKTKRTTFDAGHERRSEVRLKEVSDGLEGKIGALMSDFGNREDLRGYILSDDFPKVLQSMFGEFADTAVLLRNIRLFVSGIELPAEAETNPEIVRILPSAMAKLIQSLSVIKDHSYTIGVEAPSSGEKTVFMEQLLSVLSQRAGLVNEIAVAGRLDGEGQSSLRKLEIVVRPVIPNRPFIARNNQTAVPMVVSSAEAEISSFNAIFHPIMSEADGMTDPFVREYTDLLKVVAAIHLAELTTRNSKLLNQPQLLRAELFKSLNIAERAELQNLIQMNTSGRGFTISSVAVKIFLEMQAREAILRAA